MIGKVRRADLGHEEDASLRDVRGRVWEREHHVAGRQVAMMHALPQEGDARFDAGKERMVFSGHTSLGRNDI